MENNCLFCDKKNVEEDCFFENEYFYVILSHQPISEGHSVIIPKKHYEYLHEIPSEIILNIMMNLEKVLEKMKKAVNFESYNIAINNGELSGMQIKHVHIHIIPRFKGDKIHIERNKEFFVFTDEIKNSLRKKLIDI